MGFHHRKLMDEAPNSTLCVSSCGFCLSQAPCWDFCHEICGISPPPSPPSPDSYYEGGNPKTANSFPSVLIVTLAVLGFALIVVCCYAFYSRYYLRRHNSRRRRQPQTEASREEFLDEDDGPVVDHPIWYIRTTGLQPSVISSIAVCKYKSAEGIVEGTECSVCLGEFEEDETLRLLPKCNHAFHVPCIDTWLSSHTNCPMCRAPVVKSADRTPSPEPNVDSSGPVGETQVGVSGTSGGSDGEIEDEVCELRIVIEEEGGLPDENGEKRGESSSDIQPLRRSVSMDSLSASKISLAVSNVAPVESGGNSNNQLVKVNEGNRGNVSKRVERNQNLLRLLGTSSSMQTRPHSMKRSSSWNGKFLLCRKSTGLVLRSF